ncbi:hypothetical protein IW01_10470 [Pectobacterium brasiliense]|nr:hypothetical protein IW01_10470 [Pectobacterium brasiliense]
MVMPQVRGATGFFLFWVEPFPLTPFHCLLSVLPLLEPFDITLFVCAIEYQCGRGNPFCAGKWMVV